MTTRNITFLTLFVILLAVTAVAFQVIGRTEPAPSTTASPSPSASAAQNVTVEQTINYGDTRPSETASLSAQPGQTALALLTQSKQVTTKDTSFGPLVESIEGVTNGTDNKYWIYSVNGQESNIGAAEYIVQPNDRILWEFKAYEE